MGYEDGGDAGLALDTADLFTCLQTQARVKVGKRLVEKKNAGHLYKCARDCNSLLLTARKLARLAVHKIVDLHKSCRLESALKHCVLVKLVCTLEVLKGEEYVLLDGHMRIECIVLENQTNTSVFGRKRSYVILTEEDLPARGLLKSADHIKSGTLSATGGAKKTDKLTVGDGEGEIADSNDLFV